jgi:hypothetical protein
MRADKSQHSSKHTHAAAVLEAACLTDLLIMFSRPCTEQPCPACVRGSAGAFTGRALTADQLRVTVLIVCDGVQSLLNPPRQQGQDYRGTMLHICLVFTQMAAHLSSWAPVRSRKRLRHALLAMACASSHWGRQLWA